MIEVKNVTKKYGSFTAVDDISFEVKDHEIVGFLGPNGAGKSTTMNMITGYIEPTKGKIIINGHDISKSPIRAKKQIGYMPENVPLYPDLTVKEFVTYMAELKRVEKKKRKQEVTDILQKTGLIDVQNKLIKHVSRGYKQRVSLAGALVGNPEVLILDEPTVGLDPKQITEIRELIKSLGKNHTVILSSHILSEVSQICEKVIIINHGKIVAIDTPENLENKTNNNNSIIVTVEDKDNKVSSIKDKLDGITDIKLTKENDDNTKTYIVTAKPETDIRAEVFNTFNKEGITVLELKKAENSLEDAFLKIINDEDDTAKSAKQKREEESKKRKEELEKMSKEDRKKAKKEDKEKLKEERKKQFDEEWEKDKKLAMIEKEENKKQKEKRKADKKEKKLEKKERKQNKKEIKKETEQYIKLVLNKCGQETQLNDILVKDKEQLMKERSRLLDLCIKGIVDEETFSFKNNEIIEKINKIEIELDSQKQKVRMKENAEEILEKIQKTIDNILNIKKFSKNVCKEFVDKIVIYNDKKFDFYLKGYDTSFNFNEESNISYLPHLL